MGCPRLFRFRVSGICELLIVIHSFIPSVFQNVDVDDGIARNQGG